MEGVRVYYQESSISVYFHVKKQKFFIFKKYISSSPSFPVACFCRCESWPRRRESGRADPDPHQLQPLREQALHLTWVAYESHW